MAEILLLNDGLAVWGNLNLSRKRGKTSYQLRENDKYYFQKNPAQAFIQR